MLTGLASAALIALSGLSGGTARASGPEVWAALHDARLASSAERDPSAAIAIYETVLEFLPADDPIRGEMSYWLAREKVLEGSEGEALLLLGQASRFAEVHDRARTLRAELLSSRDAVDTLPYTATFDDGHSGWLRGWPDGDDEDLTVTTEEEPGDAVLRWQVSVRPGRDDFIALPLEAGALQPSNLRMTVLSTSQPSWLRVVFRDTADRRWTSALVAVPPDEWTVIELGLDELIRADAPFSEERPRPGELVRLEVRDVTAFHSDVRGAHPILVDDVSLN